MKIETKNRLQVDNTPEMVQKRKELRKWSQQINKKETIYEEYLYVKLVKAFKKRGDIQRQRRTFVGKKVYFIDIYIRSARLAIEIDGGYHFTEEQRMRDNLRSSDLITHNIKTIRVKNEDIDAKFEEIVNFIRRRRKDISCGKICNDIIYL